MKNIKSITTGMLIGVLTGTIALVSDGFFDKKLPVAEGNVWEDTTDLWDSAVAEGNLFEWRDVFAAVGLSPKERGQNLYRLIHNKLLIQPDEDSFEAVAQTYGLSRGEAQKIVEGDLAIIQNNSNIKEGRGTGRLTQAEAINIASDIIDDFQEARDIFELDQEIDAAVGPSEIFSNGSLDDSGFDLIHDLEVIEAVLFLENEEVTVGDTYQYSPESPFDSKEKSETFDLGSDPLGGGVGKVEEKDGASFAKIDLEGAFSSGGGGGDGTTDGIEAEVLDSDICEIDDPYGDLLKSFESGVSSGGGESDDDDDDDGGIGGPGSSDEGEEFAGIEPAPPSDWGSTFCPQFNSPQSRASEPSASTMGTVHYGGDAYDGSTSFTLQVPICISLEFIKEKTSSTAAGEDRCVNCEVERINEILDETLSYSLVPNKVTGNYLESAKCKDTFKAPLIDLKLIAISAPVLTPPNDDLIFGESIFEEWNKAVQKTGWAELQIQDENLDDFAFRAVPEGYSSIDLLVSQKAEFARLRSESLAAGAQIAEASEGYNTRVFQNTLLPQMQQMTSYFENYKKMLDQISNDVCPNIISKPSL